jgi:hypothetical protein
LCLGIGAIELAHWLTGLLDSPFQLVNPAPCFEVSATRCLGVLLCFLQGIDLAQRLLYRSDQFLIFLAKAADGVGSTISIGFQLQFNVCHWNLPWHSVTR